MASPYPRAAAENEVASQEVAGTSERQVEIKSLDGFRVMEEIGSGATAKVHVCEDVRNSQRFALKIFRKGTLKRQKDWSGGRSGGRMKVRTALDKVYDELRILRRVDHPRCIRLHAICNEADEFGKLFVVLEYAARGASMEWSQDRCCFVAPAAGGVIEEAQARPMVIDVLCGLTYLHRGRIAHRDIKPQNVLLHDDNSAKISDFGVSCDTDENGLVVGTEGTYPFFAPEMCSGGGTYSGHDGRLADVWALGVTLWAWVHGTVPFHKEDVVQLFELISEARLVFPPDGASDACRATLRRLLEAKPADRPQAWEFEADAWLQSL